MMASPALTVALLLAALQLGPASAGLFTKRFRLPRAAGANATFFSHVYNIRMPRCDSCAADVAVPTAALQEARGEMLQEARGETTQQQLYEHTLEGEQQMVFTHRINIPPQACGCPNADTMQRLLKRLEALEAQVATFRDQCPGGTCCAATQAGNGQTDIQGLCSQHGKFDFGKCLCVCEKGWGGPTCSESSCPDNCNDRGTCLDSECICHDGFTGESCEMTTCLDDCNDQGRCIGGKCVCFPGYTGPACGDQACPDNCRGHGKCIKESCVCDPGYTGPDCSAKACPDNCGGRGKCLIGSCVCEVGFGGPDCGTRTCPENCRNRGKCIDGICVCSPGYLGPDCGSRSCPENCKNRGQCINGKCICNPGFTGPACGARSCPENCHDHGQCINGKCLCNPGYSGPSCGSRICPDNCNRRGVCKDGSCICTQGFTGPNCGIRTCPENCQNRGRCQDGQCVCQAGYAGPNCGTKTCPDNCRNLGRCEDGRCVCDEGYAGANCGTKTCPDNCSNQGRCEDGTCVCETGFTGPNCGTKKCPDNCKNQGRCKDGRCACDEGFTGSNCGTKTCPDNCSNQGRCVDGTCICKTGFTGSNCGNKTCPDNCKNRGRCDNGRCVCDEGFAGSNCETKICPGNCSSLGLCVDGQCVCKAGYGGPNCGTRTCPNNCNSRGRCENGKCKCDKGYGGPICGLKLCPNNCNNQGRCLKGTCICRRGYTGPDCREVTCQNQCQGRGICVDGLCQCQAGYAGPDCSEKTCPNACSEKGRCEDGKCVCQDGFTGEDCSIEVPAVRDFRMRVRDETSVIMEWERPTIPVDGFEISFRPTKKDDGVLSSRLRSTVTTFNQSGLVPGEEYLVTIWTQKDQTLGPETTKTVTTRIDGPKNLKVTEVTQASITLHWDRPVATVDRYLVTYASEAGVARQLTVPAGRKEAVTLMELDSGTEYAVTVTAERGSESSMPASTTASTAPEPTSKSTASDESPVGAPSTQTSPSNSMAGLPSVGTEPDFRSLGKLFVANITYDSFSLSWSADPGVYDHFVVRYKDSAATEPVEVLLSGDQRTATLSHLLPGTEYEIEVHGVVDGLRTMPLTTTATTAHRKPKEQPSLLGGLAITSIAEDGFGLTWKATKGVFDLFLVRYEDAGGQFGSQEISVPGAQRVTTIRGLDSATEYIVSVYGVRRGQLSRALKTKVTTASAEGDGMPARVEDLSATDIQEDSVHLSWTVNDGDLDFFLIQYRDTDGQTQEMTIRGDLTSANISGLQHTRNYTFVLYGITDAVQTKPISVTVMTAPLTPSLGDLSVLDATQDSIRLSWSVQDGDFDSFLLQYRDPQGRSEQMPVDAGLHEVTVSGLQPAETYMFELVGISTDKQSEPVSLVAKTALPEKTAPHLFNLSATEITRDSLQLSWNASAEDFDSFLIQYRDAEGKPQELAVDGDLRSATISGLRPSKKYTFSLHGVSGDRKGTEISTEVTTATAVKAQIQPRLGKLNISDILQDSLRLSWTVQGGDFDSFLILYRDAQGNTLELPIPGDLRIATISGLKPSKKYKFLLHGISASNRSKPVSAEATTAAQKKTVAKLPKVGDISISEVQKDSLVLSWAVSGGDFDSFVIQYKDSEGIPRQLEVDGHLRTTKVKGLKPSEKYKFVLYGVSENRRAQPVSAEAITAALEVPPTSSPWLGELTVSDVTKDSVRLSWTQQGGDYDTFLIFYRDADGRPQGLPVKKDQRTARVSGLTPTTKYTFLLYGVKGRRRSTPITAEATTGPDMVQAPKPTLANLAISEVTEDSLQLSWAVQGGDFDTFLIQYRDPEENPLEVEVDGNQHTTTISDLVPSKKYTFYLQGIIGTERVGPISTDAVTASLEKHRTRPARLGDLSISNITQDSLQLAWTIQDGDFDSFLIQYRDVDGKVQELPVDRELRSVTISGLRPSKKYKFILYGLTGDRRSKSISTDGTTVPFEKVTTRLPRLSDLSVSDITKDSLQLSWDVEDGVFGSFLIQYRDADGTPRVLTVDGDFRTARIVGLKPAKKYKFSIYGVSGDRRTKALATEAITAPPEKAITHSPRLGEFFVSDITKDSLQLAWTAEGGDFDSFVIQYRDTDGQTQEVVVDGDIHSTTITGLLPSRKYQFNLYGISRNKRTKPISTEATTAFPEAVGQQAAMLDDLYLSDVGPHTGQLSWEASEGAFDSFLIQYADSHGVAPKSEMVMAGNARTAMIEGLEPNTEYTFTLSGLHRGQKRANLSTVGRTSRLDLEPPRNLEFRNIKETSLMVTWTRPSMPIDTFKVSYQLADGGEPQSLSVDGKATKVPLKGLTPGARYEVNVMSIRGFEESEPLTGYVTTVPDGPTDLRAINVTETSALLLWRPALATIDTYVVTFSAHNVPEVTKIISGNTAELQLRGLNIDTEYTATIHSTKGSNHSSPAIATFTTSADAPRDLTASRVSPRSAVLSWTPPKAVPTGYILTYEAPSGETKEIQLEASANSYTLSELIPSSQYRARVQAMRGKVRTAPTSTMFNTARLRYPFPRDCAEERLNGAIRSQPMTIYLKGDRSHPIKVFCDMDTDGGGWMVFQRRMNGKTNFWRNWDEYAAGFGNLTQEFWLGNENLHKLTSQGAYELRVDLRTKNESAYAVYDSFRVDTQNNHYRLRLGKYSGTAGDSLSYHNNMIFSTRDRDRNKHIMPCSISYRGAWWYKNCHYVNLNGLYGNNKDHQGINWYNWKGFEFSIPFTEMKMRPKNSVALRRI
ncbi:tenascin-X isoform X11 [Lissotriton helveticus]